MDVHNAFLPRQGSSIPTQQPPSRKEGGWLRRVINTMRRYWYVVIIVLVIAVGIVTWQILRVREDAAWQSATDHFTRAEYDKAAKELQDVAMPSSPERLRVYAQTMLAMRQLDKSLVAYEKLYATTKDASVRLIIGNIYNEQKKYDKAITIYKDLIANNATNIQAYVNLAMVYKLQNDTTSAVQIAKDGVEKNPTSVVLHELKVEVLMGDKNSQDYKDAVAALRKLNPKDQFLQVLNEQT